MCLCGKRGYAERFFLHPDDSGFPYLLRIFARCFAIQKVLPSDQKSGGGSKKSSGTGTTDPPVLDVSLFSFAPFGDSDLP